MKQKKTHIDQASGDAIARFVAQEYLTVEEVSKIMKISRQAVLKKLYQSKLKGELFLHNWFILKSELRKHLLSRSVKRSIKNK